MSTEPETSSNPDEGAVEMPAATAWPMVLGLGVVLMAAGVATSLALSAVGLVIFAAGLAGWIWQLLPGQGHIHEPLVEPAQRPQPIAGTPGTVEQLGAGMPGHRLRLPEKVHPISAGLKGGLVGGLVMPLPALAYGLLSGRGIWYPVNLLAAMVVPNIPEGELGNFNPAYFGTAVVIHVVMSVVLGLIYGVLLPTLPAIPKPLAWGGLLMPLLWSAVSYGLMGLFNKDLVGAISWPSFIASQLLFGVTAAAVVLRWKTLPPVRAGLLGGVAGGVLMVVPALLWGLASGRGLWYPVNVLAAMILRIPPHELSGEFNPTWFGTAVALHAVFSAAFGLAYGLILPRVPPIPQPLVWGGLLLPLVWTGASYSLLGVVNATLQKHVDWPAFIASQFVFGVAAAFMVLRSEQIHIPPAGAGPDRAAAFATGQGEGSS